MVGYIDKFLQKLQLLMRLSNLIAKEIRLKHLNEGIMHMQTRKKYRNYKLREHYQTPTPATHQLILYSNIHGNQFILNPHHFHTANFPHPNEAYYQIVELHKQINEAIYQLWVQSKSYADKTYFPVNSRVLFWSMIGVWVVSLLLCVADRVLVGSETIVQWVIITAIASTIVLNLAVLIRTLSSKYQLFEYDHQIVRLVGNILMEAEERLHECGLEVRCDRQMTWICFRVKDSGMMEENSMREHEEVEIS